MSNAHGLTNESQVVTCETEINKTTVIFFLKRSVIFNSQVLLLKTALIGLGGLRKVRNLRSVEDVECGK